MERARAVLSLFVSVDGIHIGIPGKDGLVVRVYQRRDVSAGIAFSQRRDERRGANQITDVVAPDDQDTRVPFPAAAADAEGTRFMKRDSSGPEPANAQPGPSGARRSVLGEPQQMRPRRFLVEAKSTSQHELQRALEVGALILAWIA